MILGIKKFHAGNLVENPNMGIKITGKCHKPVNGNAKFFPVIWSKSLVFISSNQQVKVIETPCLC